jgi:hypothetical protein
MEVRTAKCHCGALSLVCEGPPTKVSLCHCDDCQRRTGSAFSIAAFYLRTNIHHEGTVPLTWERSSASGFPVLFHFCGRCGTNLYWEPRRMPDLIGVAVGAFADPNFPMPEQAVRAREKLAWVVHPKHMKVFDDFPLRKAPV